MKTSRPKSGAPYQSAPIIVTPQLPSALEQIRQRAHEIYVARGRADGQALNDWLTAESELNQEH